MDYIYRYRACNVNVYIGITNNLKIRNTAHEKDWWFNEQLIYEYIELPNRFIAEIYEKYLINGSVLNEC